MALIRNGLRAAVVLLILAAAPVAVRAIDGQIDLNLDPAATTTISTPGSYVLVANVTMTANVAAAIAITVNNVTIDLHGHTITAAAGNTFFGVAGAAVTDTVIENGAIAGFGSSAIVLGARAIVRRMTVTGNNTIGGNRVINAGNNALVENCVASGNSPATGSTTAIAVGANSRVIGNIVENNASADSFATGINANTGCVVEGNTVRQNDTSGAGGAIGVFASFRCIVRNNVVTDNDANGTGSATGISAGAGSLIEGNVCADHDCLGAGTTGTATGISASSCTILNNDCQSNSGSINGSGVGINCNNTSQVRGNRCAGNNGTGTGTGVGILGGGNCRIEGNNVETNSGGAFGWGIRIGGTSNYVADNFAQGNGTAGAVFVFNTLNRSERNRFRQATGIDLVNGVAPASAPVAGTDLADLTF